MPKDFDYGRLCLQELNKTHIALIPKVPNPGNTGQFRPISLCNNSYKILSKILANRLKPFLPFWTPRLWPLWSSTSLRSAPLFLKDKFKTISFWPMSPIITWNWKGEEGRRTARYFYYQIHYDRPKHKRKSQLSVVQSNGLNRIDQGSSTTSEVNNVSHLKWTTINYKRLYDIEKRATISTSKLDRSNSHSSYCFSNHFPSLIEWIKKVPAWPGLCW